MNGRESTLAVLFAGVSGSARLYEKLSDSEALYAVDRCLRRMARAIEGFRGRIVKNAGDEVLAVFESVADAFQAASEMQLRIADLPPVSGVKLAIRVGFDHGVVTETDGEVFGDCVNAAARLAGLAKAGQVLISSQAQALLPRLLLLSMRDLGAQSGRGKGDEQHVFELVWQDAKAPAVSTDRLRPSGAAAGGQRARLRVRYGADVIVLDDDNVSMSMGRDVACEIVLRDRHASRNHARIERRGEAFVLSDQSTNGTFVTFQGEPEFYFRREEVVLRGSGTICVASSATSAGADVTEFEHL